MTYRTFVIALGMVAASPTLASPREPLPEAPVANSKGEICLRVAPLTGNIAETVRCWTREEWADQGVDVDKEWAENGVVLNA